MNSGVLYIFHGEEKYRTEAIVSAQSLKKASPDVHITAFSDVNFESEYFDDVVTIKPSGIRSKVQYLYDSPYDHTLYLDADVIINRDISEMFSILSKFDLGIAHDLGRKREKYSRIMPEYQEIPYSFSEVNGGVILFKKNDRTQELFELWKKYYGKYNGRLFKSCSWDQPSFRISLWRSSVSFYIFPPEYNIRSMTNREKQDKFHHEFGEDHLAPRIFHMHHSKNNLEDALTYCIENAQPY